MDKTESFDPEDIGKEENLIVKPRRMIMEFFPAEYLALNKEIAGTEYHPRLVAILSQLGAQDIDMKLAHIAAYCEIALEGEYTIEDRIKLCRLCHERLILLREYPESQEILPIH